MKFGQLTEHNVRNISLQKPCKKNGAGELVQELFMFSKKSLYEVEVSGQHVNLNIFWYIKIKQTIKANCITFGTADPGLYPISSF